jgi:hypothetical protein
MIHTQIRPTDRKRARRAFLHFSLAQLSLT